MNKEIRWKFVAVVAILAMAVALLSGGLSGIRFGTLMLRALIGGMVFAVLAVFLNILIARFFPEILESDEIPDSGSTADVDESDADAPGSRIDILMPEDVLDIPRKDGNGEENPGESGLSPNRGGNPAEPDTAESEDSDHKDGETMGDLDRFSSDFSEVDGEFSGSAKTRTRSDGPMGDHDPEELAQAVQTILKREEKG